MDIYTSNSFTFSSEVSSTDLMDLKKENVQVGIEIEDLTLLKIKVWDFIMKRINETNDCPRFWWETHQDLCVRLVFLEEYLEENKVRIKEIENFIDDIYPHEKENYIRFCHYYNLNTAHADNHQFYKMIK